MAQVSNAANSTVTVGGTPSVLPLNADGANNKAYNNPSGFGSVDLTNNWFDIRFLHLRADMRFRVTVGNNAGAGQINGANIIVRLIPDVGNPGVYIDAPSSDVNFKGQAQFQVNAYADGVEAVQICTQTANAQDIRTYGIYMSVDDMVNL